MTIRGLTLAGVALALCMIPPAQAAGKHTIPVTVEGTLQGGPDRYVLTIGQGSVTAMPDTAVVSGGVVTRARSAGDALHDNAASMAKVVAALKTRGVTDKQITASSVRFEPVYPPYDPKTGQSTKVIGYQVSNEVIVTLTDLGRAGDVLDALIENGANDSATIAFEIKDREALETKARAEAGKDALKRAQTFAAQIGTELGAVRSIREGAYSDSVGDFETVTVTGARAAYAPPPPPPPPPPPGTMAQAGEQTISSTVTVVWALK